MAEYREIYCSTCKKVIGRYNIKYYTDDRIGEVIKANHSLHVTKGHLIELRRVTS